ncbi:hypothetical protein PVAND_001047 [Polypedilum vanderplanki]|uniref:CCR4-NOT transcription complex subunit 11 n=1 Tax=Polypedilum vanderplanki TaxID=319348 RepID=A0A9J6BLR0_POLVA|nr:hypothetical protein PVAND_001047 [Polypedilum vanderplanki]
MHRSPLPILADFLFLHNLLNEKSLDHMSFESVSAHVQKKFQKNDLISVGSLLCFLIKNNDLAETNNRLVAYYLLYDIFRNDNDFDSGSPRDSPFIYFLFQVIESKDPNFKLTQVERNFIIQLLASGTKDLCKQTPHHIRQTDLLKIPFDLTAVRKMCMDKDKEIPANVKSNVMNVLSAPVKSEVTDSAIRELMEGLFRRDTPLKSVFGPQFMTIAPPLLPCDTDEIVWFDPNSNKFRPIQDNETIASSQSTETEIEKLVATAFKQALTLHDQKILENELEKDKELVNHIGLTPAKLSDLVENNPLIAIKCLLMLMNSVQITEYLRALVNMEMSLHSVEVVNRLTTVVELPSEFIHLYISNCISTCEGIQDKFLQNRLVRLLCVFLQSLIRKKIINVKELFIEVEAFCVEFSRIREAADLYKLCKSL